jgi:hypothetical protein
LQQRYIAKIDVRIHSTEREHRTPSFETVHTMDCRIGFSRLPVTQAVPFRFGGSGTGWSVEYLIQHESGTHVALQCFGRIDGDNSMSRIDGDNSMSRIDGDNSMSKSGRLRGMLLDHTCPYFKLRLCHTALH